MNTLSRSVPLLFALCFVAAAAVAQEAPAPAPAVISPAAPTAAPGVPGPASDGAPGAAAATPAQPGAVADADTGKKAAAAPTCRTVKVTGSRVRTQKICTTRGSEQGSQEWLRDQQHRGTSEGRNGVNGGGG